MKARSLLTVALALLVLAGCGGESSAATLSGPLEYLRDGGFAGVGETLKIQPDGRARVDGGSRGRRNVKLRKTELDQVARLVRDADLARVKVRRTGGGADVFYYAIGYRGRTLKFDDTSFPKQVGKLNALHEKYG